MHRHRRWKAVALLAAGMAVGTVLVGTPAGAHVSSWAHNWNKHIKPKADKRYLPGRNLPAGKTIRGTYRIAGNDQGAGFGLGASAISFGFTLRSAPEPHFIPTGVVPPPECPGNVGNPQAQRGHLCVYERTDINAQGQLVGNPVTNASGVASRYGAFVLAQSGADGTWTTSGTWAVRSP